MLQMVKDDARQMIMGAIFTFKTFIEKTATANFSDVHGAAADLTATKFKASFVFDDERIPLIQPRYESTT